jgi:hypothetical protein
MSCVLQVHDRLHEMTSGIYSVSWLFVYWTLVQYGLDGLENRRGKEMHIRQNSS